MARLADRHLAWDPGTQFEYHNTNYAIAARLVEAVSGRPFDEFLETELFAPLGMDETVFAVPDRLVPRLAGAWLRTEAGLEPVAAVPASAPEFWGMGHCLVGTGADYVRFLRMLLGGGALVLAALLVFWRYRVVSDRQFGGITGDLAGWFLQKAELWMLAALCACQWGGLL